MKHWQVGIRTLLSDFALTLIPHVYVHSHTHMFTCILLSCIALFLHPGDSLETAEIEAIVDGVIQESDVARNHELSYAEFEHVISRAPDFINLFHITI